MTTYSLYVNNQPVHECSEHYEAHDVYTRSYAIEEWRGLPIYTAIDGVPQWGITPEKQKGISQRRTLSALRSRYLKSVVGTSEEERETVAKQKLAAIVADSQAQSAKITSKK